MRQTSDCELAARLATLRHDRFGEHGGPLLAMMLGISFREWAGYERGKPVPTRVLGRLAEVTGLDEHWLRTGRGDAGDDDRSRPDFTTVGEFRHA